MHIPTHLSKRRWTKPPARRTPAEKRTPDVTYTCLARSFITTASHAPRMDTNVNTPIERPFHPSTVIAILVFYMLLNCRKAVNCRKEGVCNPVQESCILTACSILVEWYSCFVQDFKPTFQVQPVFTKSLTGSLLTFFGTPPSAHAMWRPHPRCFAEIILR